MKKKRLATALILAVSIAISSGAARADHGDECLDPNGPYGLPGVSGPPEEIGDWTAPQTWPVQATHAIVMHTNKVLFFRDGGTVGLPTTSYVWDIASESITATPSTPSSDIFCSGHAILPDGRVYVSGGTLLGGLDFGPDATNIFDPITERWTRASDMHYGRYYPTATVLADGRVLAAEGSTKPADENGPAVYASIPEIYDPVADTYTALPLADTQLTDTYPFHFVTPTGTVFYAGQRSTTRQLDLDTQIWTFVDYANFASGGGTAAMIEPGVILKAGGSPIGTELPTDQAEMIDFNAATPEWQLVATMTYPRRRANMVLLPDGKALIVGGGIATADGQVMSECAVHAPELYDPATDTWTQMKSHQRSRQYHSTAILLPDGRVLAAGGENSSIGGEENYEIFSPPYLFLGPRPIVAAAPSAAAYDGTFQVSTPDVGSIVKVSLLRPNSVTHNWDENQRFLPLSFQVVSTKLFVDAPTDANQAPPGHYMLFLVNDAGVPSLAHWIKIGATCVPTTDTETACANGLDDDCDGLVDLGDLDCDPPVPFQPAGSVPDGMLGTPLTLSYDYTEGLMTMSWGASCNGADSDYAIYEGDIGDWTNTRRVLCSTNGATSRTFDRSGNVFFLVVPNNGVREGGYGLDSNGIQRPAAADACLPQDPATCE